MFWLSVAFIAYMIINTYTDSKRKETYNRLHLIMLIIITFTSINEVKFNQYLSVILLSLLIGLIVENIPSIKIGAGDTKMLIVSSAYLFVVTGMEWIYIPFILFILMKTTLIIFSVTFGSVCLIYDRYIKSNKQLEHTYKWMTYTFKWSFEGKIPLFTISMPATIFIFLSTLLMQNIL